MTILVSFERRSDVLERKVDSDSGQICHIRRKIWPIMFALRRFRHLIKHGTDIGHVHYPYVFHNYRF
jgi:hypothetical protein